MNYYGINRKVNVAGYVQGYKSPVTKCAENGNNNTRLVEAFVQKHKTTKVANG